VHEANCTYKLIEIDMGNVLCNSRVGFNLVEQVTPFSKFHSNPLPRRIISMVEEFDYILVQADMFV
jgi:hypothetical protein